MRRSPLHPLALVLLAALALRAVVSVAYTPAYIAYPDTGRDGVRRTAGAQR